VRASFFAASEASRKASHVCFLFFSTWGFSFKIYELKKSLRKAVVRIQTEYKLQIQDLQAPEQKGRRGKFIVTSTVK